MQIQLVIGEQDKRYLEHFVTYMEKNHMDQLEIVSFSMPQLLTEYLKSNKPDLVILDEAFGTKPEDLKHYSNLEVACFCESSDTAVSEGVWKIEKYKKPELIFQDILAIYAETAGKTGVLPRRQGNNRMTLVTGFSGGTGSSVFAAALAKNLSSQGKRTLYLNLETAGSSTDFFSGPGNYNFGEVIFALKSQKADIKLKMESSVRMDQRSGVFFFEPCETAMYMLELNHEDLLKILDIASGLNGVDQIVVDMDLSLSAENMEILGRMDQIVLLCDGTETANTKTKRSLQALEILERQTRINVTPKLVLLYNRFSSSASSSEIQGLHIPVIGKIPPIKHALAGDIIQFIQGRRDIFQKLSE